MSLQIDLQGGLRYTVAVDGDKAISFAADVFDGEGIMYAPSAAGGTVVFHCEDVMAILSDTPLVEQHYIDAEGGSL